MLDNVHVPVGERARHDRRRPQSRVQHPQPRAREAGHAQHRRRAAGAESVHRLREGAPAVRQGDLRVRAGEAEARRDVRALLRRRGDGLPRARRRRSRARGHRSKPTAPDVLKTIENFAVECSINKVATSEALAYVVDEAVQVFGGNGYSREFPVERAYRDARITRIYEGTNEINRLIIPTRLLKSGDAARRGQPSMSGASGSALRCRARARWSTPSAWRERPSRAAKRGLRRRCTRRAGSARARREHHHRVVRDRERARARREAGQGRQRSRRRWPPTSPASTPATPPIAWRTPASRS